MNIFLHKIKHKLWENYKFNPPINYKKIRFFSKIEHSFNKIYNNKKSKIIEFEQILLLTGNSLDYHFMINERHKLIERLIKNDIKFLISPTDIAKKNALYYLNENEIIAKKIKILYPSINLEKFNNSVKKSLNNSKVNLLFIGQKFYGKGVPICFKIAKTLKKKKIDFNFKIVCSDIPKNIDIPENVQIIDTRISEDYKYKLYNWCHLFIFPVVQDSFGVYLECLETKTPIISTDIFDKSNIIINNKTGTLIKTPFQLYEDKNFGYNWKNWDEFQEYFKERFSEGLFDDLV
ncbi:glycosyltransferase, partial [Pelagibacteraceae bacterium]|nr:glycosyltransferase [Pelagibacteraceae bacterium]